MDARIQCHREDTSKFLCFKTSATRGRNYIRGSLWRSFRHCRTSVGTNLSRTVTLDWLRTSGIGTLSFGFGAIVRSADRSAMARLESATLTGVDSPLALL